MIKQKLNDTSVDNQMVIEELYILLNHEQPTNSKND